MLSVIPVAFVAIPLTAIRLVLTSNVARLGAFLMLGAYLTSRGYRPGEGILSPKMPIHIVPGNDVGGVLFEMTESFRGRTFAMTRSEANSLVTLIEAVDASPSAKPALEDFLTHFPADRTT